MDTINLHRIAVEAMRIRNSSITEFAFTPKRHSLVCYNAIPHLEHPDYTPWVTYT